MDDRCASEIKLLTKKSRLELPSYEVCYLCCELHVNHHE